MLRFTHADRTRWSALALLALVTVSGCSDSNPVDPAPGSSASGVQLFGFQDTPIPYFEMLDPATPTDPIDDVLLNTGVYTFGGDSTSAVMQVLDATPASSLRPYRREGTAEYRRFLDYDVLATDRRLGENIDVFTLRDATGTAGASEYFVNGIVNGVENATGPSSNRVLPWVRPAATLALSINRIQRDSVLSLSFTPDTRAAFYILEYFDYTPLVIQRDLSAMSAVPMPIALPHQYNVWRYVLRGQETTIRIPLYKVPFLKGLFPLTKLVRVTGMDESGRVIARSQTDFIQRNTGRDDIGNNLYTMDPLGGWVITLDPYSPRGYNRPQAGASGIPGVVTWDEASRMTGGLVPSGPMLSTQDLRAAVQRAAAGLPAPGRGLAGDQTLPAGILRTGR